MKVPVLRSASALLGLAVFVIAGCGGSGSGGKTGRISIAVSDGPVHEASKVCIAFDEIELHTRGESILVGPDDLTMNEPVNLLDFQDVNAAPLLTNFEIPAGDYQWVRLGVNAVRGGTGGTGNDDTLVTCQGDASYIVTPDGVFNLYVPSGLESGLKLVNGFTMPVNGSADFTAEFDLMSSVTAPNGLSPDVVFRPTIRLVNNVEVGTLTGQVDDTLVPAEGCAASVYLFDDGVTPNAIDMDGSDPNDPIATAIVADQANGVAGPDYRYTIGFLLEGSYEAAFTCDDGVTFEPVNGKPAEIVAGDITNLPFP